MNIPKVINALCIVIGITIIQFIFVRLFSKEEPKSIKQFLTDDKIMTKIFVFIIIYVLLHFRD